VVNPRRHAVYVNQACRIITAKTKICRKTLKIAITANTCNPSNARTICGKTEDTCASTAVRVLPKS
ncbi:MAG: hypothetical protein ACK521_06715, partial [bacterium]